MSGPASLVAVELAAETDGAQALAALVERRGPAAVLVRETIDTEAAAAAAAAALGLPLATGVVDVALEAGLVRASCHLPGAGILEIAFPGAGSALLAVRPQAWPALVEELETIVLDGPPARLRRISLEESRPAGIEDAPLLVAVGRGLADPARLPALERLAQALGGALCVSGALTEAGWAPPSLKVGISGREVSPSVYLALGISGAPQHMEAIASTATVIAVNTDPAAAIFAVADYGVVADLAAVVDELEALVGPAPPTAPLA